MEKSDFLNKIIDKAKHKNKMTNIDIFLIQHNDSIKQALDLKIPAQVICETIMEETNIKVSYSTMLRKLKKLKNTPKKEITAGEDIVKRKPQVETAKTVETNEPHIITSKHKKFTFNNEK